MTVKNNTNKLRVFIQGPGSLDFFRMFSHKPDRYTGAKDVDDADIVLFTGGSDVNPRLYGENPLKFTSWDDNRDTRDSLVYDVARKNEAFLVGVCRGGQLLNVLNGGRLWQHVEGHGKDHRMTDLDTRQVLTVSSTHHQMMIPHDDALPVAKSGVSKFKRAENHGWDRINEDKPELMDDEVLYYPKSRSLCFQPHPEYVGYPECREYFFDVIERFINE